MLLSWSETRFPNQMRFASDCCVSGFSLNMPIDRLQIFTPTSSPCRCSLCSSIASLLSLATLTFFASLIDTQLLSPQIQSYRLSTVPFLSKIISMIILVCRSPASCCPPPPPPPPPAAEAPLLSDGSPLRGRSQGPPRRDGGASPCGPAPAGWSWTRRRLTRARHGLDTGRRLTGAGHEAG